MRVLCRRTTPDDFGRNRWADISIHVLRAEDDCFWCSLASPETHFNPRPPCGGRPCRRKCCRSPRRISIHVLRVEDDPRRPVKRGSICSFQSTSSVWRTTLTILVMFSPSSDFNPRPPCGGRQEIYRQAPAATIFQSTSSMWRTTPYQCRRWCSGRYFNPRPPCGGRRFSGLDDAPVTVFQSTSSVWRTTPSHASPYFHQPISIHVLRVEDDAFPGWTMRR